MKKAFSFLLSFIIIYSCLSSLFITSVSAASFTPRTTEPSSTNKYYLHTSVGGVNECIVRSDGSVLPNCVGYAWGRAYEILGSKPNLAKTNANTWYNHNKLNGFYSYGSTPKLGAIMCWNHGSAGHVAVVEKIEGSTITISESHYSGTRFDIKQGTQSQIEGYLNNFQGYIYIGDFSQYPQGVSAFGYDYPIDGQEIADKEFTFQGWVETNKPLSSVTCSINDGQAYVTANLYKRPDVPNATAFLATIPTKLLQVGENKIAVCINYTDSTAVVAGYRTVNRTRPTVLCGFDYPSENQKILDNKFLFQGWVMSDKEIKDITCSLNDGQKYYTANLYTRSDVPDAVAFRKEIDSNSLSYGENKVSVCVTYADGTAETVATRNVNKRFAFAVDSPKNNSNIDSNTLLVQGWYLTEKNIEKIQCVVNSKEVFETKLYVREDMPDATAFRNEISKCYLNQQTNKIDFSVTYSDGSSEIFDTRTVYNKTSTLGHNYAEKVTKPATCTESGIKTFSCGVCGDSYTEKIPAKNHTIVIDKEVAPSCTQTGLTEGKHCSECNEVIIAQQVIPAKGHTEVIDKGYEATFEKEGLTDGSHCSVCNEVLVKQEIIPIVLIIGDADGDGVVTIVDATLIQQHIAELKTIEDDKQICADTDKDGHISILDATRIQLFLAQVVPNL